MHTPDLKTGDLNLDGKIDILDLNLLQHTLLQENNLASIGDQNGDNKVDVIDLQILFNRLERKWQEKRTNVPGDFLQSPSTVNIVGKFNLIKVLPGFIREKDAGYSPSPFHIVPLHRGYHLATELQFLIGFLCHAPPIC